jgi:hypothetical protein
MHDAEDAWFAKDFPRARRCFQGILHVRPTHQAANERMAALFFIDVLQAEELQHFDCLVEPPEFPIIDFAPQQRRLIIERFDHGAELAKRFLQRTEDDGQIDYPRAKARLIHAECRSWPRRSALSHDRLICFRVATSAPPLTTGARTGVVSR